MRDYLYFRRRVIGAALLFAALSAVILFLGGVPLGALGYPAAVCGVLGLCFGVWDLLRYRRKIRTLESSEMISPSPAIICRSLRIPLRPAIRNSLNCCSRAAQNSRRILRKTSRI